MLLRQSIKTYDFLVIQLVSGIGTVVKRETSKAQRIYQYIINVKGKFTLDFELPASIDLLQSGQKVEATITKTKPKDKKYLLALRGEIYQIEKTSTSITYIVFFAGLQGHIKVKRAIAGFKLRIPIFLSIK